MGMASSLKVSLLKSSKGTRDAPILKETRGNGIFIYIIFFLFYIRCLFERRTRALEKSIYERKGESIEFEDTAKASATLRNDGASRRRSEREERGWTRRPERVYHRATRYQRFLRRLRTKFRCSDGRTSSCLIFPPPSTKLTLSPWLDIAYGYILAIPRGV